MGKSNKSFQTLTRAELKKIFFRVEKVPYDSLISDQIAPDMEYENSLTHAILAHMPNGKRKIVNACSSDYELLTNQELIEPVLEAMDKAFGDIEIKSYNFGFARIKLELRVKSVHGKKMSKGTVSLWLRSLTPMILLYDTWVVLNYLR